MSMLKCFFEIGDKQKFFQGLQIEQEAALCEEYMGKFPVISISLKGIEGENFEAARAMMCSEIGNEVLRFGGLMKNDVFCDSDREKYRQLTTIDTTGKEMFAMTDAALANSLKTLSLLLEKYYGKKTIILIDEYDVPLAKAFDKGYYPQMVNLLRECLSRR